MGKRLDSKYLPGQALARLAQVQDARRAGVRRRRLHEGQGSARVVVRLARAGDERARGAGVGRQRRHRLRRRRAGAAAEEAQAARAQDARRSRSRRRCRASARATSSGSSRSSSPRSRSPSGRTTAACARRSTWGCARTRTRARCGSRRREPIPDVIRKGKRVLRLSNLDKPFWPEEGITKGDLLAYYRDVAAVLVPHIRERPFTLKRYPDGWQGKFFFQKDAPAGMPDWIPTVELEVSTREKPRQRRKIKAPARERRARIAVDGEHGLHRPEHLVLATGQARPARLRALRPRSLARCLLSARRCRWRCS